MSWDIELWDQFDTISAHTIKGIEFLDKLGHFVKDRCLIETDYASRLRKLAKNYDTNKKKETDSEKEFTYCLAFNQVLKEITDMAGQHEVIAENLSQQVVKEIQTICKDLREERKKHLNEGVKYQTLLTSSLNQLDKSKKSYDKAFKESEKAQENYQKADKDYNLSRADLDRARILSLNKERACENSKTDYAKQLQVANQAQREHYTQFMPKVFQQLQDMETRRINTIKNLMKLSATVQKNVIPIVNRCLDGIVDAAESIDPGEDAQNVVCRYKSGMQPPDDIPFEDLSNRSTNDSANDETDSISTTQSKGNSLKHSQSLKSDKSFRHTFTRGGLKKRTKLLNFFGPNKNDFSDLPPNQKRKKIQSKIDSLQSQISQANNVKDGLMVMRQAYEENGAFGDPKTIESQLRENDATVERLSIELQRHLVLLDELDGGRTGATLNNGSVVNGDSRVISNDTSENETTSKSPSIANSHNRTFEPDLEISRTNSDNSLRLEMIDRAERTKSSATNRTSNSFDDSIRDSVSTTGNDEIEAAGRPEDPNTVHLDGDTNKNAQQKITVTCLDSPCDLPSQANARALYPFKAGPAGSISMAESEQFDVIESDQGDGWTRVRRKVFDVNDDAFIGFVPTSYIAIDPHSTSCALNKLEKESPEKSIDQGVN